MSAVPSGGLPRREVGIAAVHVVLDDAIVRSEIQAGLASKTAL
jgi:hypothetical protein